MMQTSVSTANLVALLGTGATVNVRPGAGTLSQPPLPNRDGRRDSAAAHCRSLLSFHPKRARQPRAQAFVLEPDNGRIGNVVFQPGMLAMV